MTFKKLYLAVIFLILSGCNIFLPHKQSIHEIVYDKFSKTKENLAKKYGDRTFYIFYGGIADLSNYPNLDFYTELKELIENKAKNENICYSVHLIENTFIKSENGAISVKFFCES